MNDSKINYAMSNGELQTAIDHAQEIFNKNKDCKTTENHLFCLLKIQIQRASIMITK